MGNEKTTTENEPLKSGSKIKILKAPAGRFGISDNIGDTVKLEKKQMETMVDAGFAKWVK